MIHNLVIGGGLAGSALAIGLAQAGRPVVLLEREVAAHDKVCGEFLSYEAVASLRSLGINLESLGAVSVGEVRLFHREAEVRTALPFTALSLSRRILDEALLVRAADAGVEVRRGVRVTSLTLGGSPTVTTDTGAPMSAREVFLASGKHDVRGAKRPSGKQSDLVGFKQYWRLSAAQADELAGAVELHLFDGGYAGLEPVEGGLANLCLVLRKARLNALGGGWPALSTHLLAGSPGLSRRLEGAHPVLGRPLAIAAIPYGYVRRRSDGIWRLGDQAAVIPSFSGEGMSIALHSAGLAARYALTGRSADDYQRALHRQVSGQVQRATLISQAMVRPLGQSAATWAAQLCPRLIALVASGTRLSRSATRLTPQVEDRLAPI